MINKIATALSWTARKPINSPAVRAPSKRQSRSTTKRASLRRIPSAHFFGKTTPVRECRGLSQRRAALQNAEPGTGAWHLDFSKYIFVACSRLRARSRQKRREAVLV
jgi:hypothetical protein